MQRRQYLRATGGCFSALALSGCGAVISERGQGPEYPGGTLVVENTGDAPVGVAVETKLDQYEASLNTEVPGGEMAVRREFVTAEQDDIVSLKALLGETGDRITFQFLPAGSEDDSPPEVARLTFETAVEASATWSATPGT